MSKKILLAFIFGFVLSTQISAQDARVVRSSATTSDNISFEAWVNNSVLSPEQRASITYKIVNRSDKSIYLVRKVSEVEFVIEDDKVIFPRPVVLVDGHEQFDYHFREIKGKSSFLGQLRVPATNLDKLQYDSMLVLVGFGYVLNIQGLHPKGEELRDPLPYISLLSSRLQTLQLSGLYVDLPR